MCRDPGVAPLPTAQENSKNPSEAFLKICSFLCLHGGCACERACVWCAMCAGQKTTTKSQLSPLTTWTPGIELGLLDLAASAFTCSAILLALEDFKIKFCLTSFVTHRINTVLKQTQLLFI